MDGIIPESLINNITQRDEERLDGNENEYRVNENSDEGAINLTMYKSRDGTVCSKSSSNPLQGRRGIENISHVHGDVTRFFVNLVDTSADVFQELLSKNSLFNIQKYTVAEANNNNNNNNKK